jgi:VIT1/CCC1 family predicted Fe2+/Mn2+ transporter
MIDAGFYLLGCLSDRGHKLRLLRQLRRSFDQDEARRIMAKVLPPLIESHLHCEAIESLRQELMLLPEPPKRPRLTAEDWKGALGVLLFASTAILPITIPFAFMSDARLALLVSHCIAILLLFLAGWALGRLTSEHPLRVGFSMVVFGSAMIAIALALGG